jgi:hypothetical protein
MKNAVFWDVAPCRSCESRRFGGACRLHLQDIRKPTVNAVSFSLVPFTLNMKATGSFLTHLFLTVKDC